MNLGALLAMVWIMSVDCSTFVSFLRAGEEVANGAKIMSDSGKNVGKLITRLGGLGLALLRVKEMYVW